MAKKNAKEKDSSAEPDSVPEESEQAEIIIEEAVEVELSPLEARRLAKLESSKEFSQLPPVKVIYVPGKGMPGHAPTFFGRPFDMWLTPMVPQEVPGKIAKLLACEFPRIIFMDDGSGNPVPFPSNKPENASKQSKGEPRK